MNLIDPFVLTKLIGSKMFEEKSGAECSQMSQIEKPCGSGKKYKKCCGRNQ